jgi:hypothetical protein
MDTTISPIPVLFSQGLPGDDDVDDDGQLWVWNDVENDWEYQHIRTRTRAHMINYSQWLPFYDNPLEWEWE